jgi:hypothetical protein
MAAMRWIACFLLIATVASAAPSHPPAEQCAAMLLSPGAEWRKAGRNALTEGASVAYREKVLEHLARWAHDRSAWVDALEKSLDKTNGPRHVAVRLLLKILRHSGEDDIGVDIVLVDLPREEATALIGKRLPAIAFDDLAGWNEWWKTLARSKQATAIFHASMPGKEAHEVRVERKRQITYVKSFEVKGKVASPEMGEIETGAFLRWRPIISRNREFVTLHFGLKLVEVVRPMKVKEVPIGNFKGRCQVPELFSKEENRSVTLRLGGAAVLSLGNSPGATQARVTLAFVRARTGSPLGIPKLPIAVKEIGQGIPPRPK